jgi:hypothetical protein
LVEGVGEVRWHDVIGGSEVARVVGRIVGRFRIRWGR